MQIEKIICSAILCPDKYIVRGHRHNDCLRTISEMPRYKGISKGDFIQGFMTSENRFVDRVEAMQIAKNALQVENTINERELFSEDIY